ncbi:hypothetical protein [Tahibacter caeni]|uniref:hypothetical protein n=1 Tax=Tahibacter caeni TaxID=1453545 RepID=UPI002147E39D|nr:hypothetical protein [Tahibacter caeni]
MSQRFGAAFGAILALLLLLLFAAATLHWIAQIVMADGAEIKKSAGYVYVLTTVAGLVSALVIAQLSVTRPGAAPTIAGLSPESRLGTITLNTVVAVYLVVWILTGFAALVVGVMFYPPEANKTISDLGTTWLGLAVSAAYAYFGISPGTVKEKRVTQSAGDSLHLATLELVSNVAEELGQRIAAGRIVFDAGKPQLRDQLLRTNAGPRITPKLQSFVLHLCDISREPIRISDLLRPSGTSHHVAGRAVDIGNEEIAKVLLPLVATDAQVNALGIDEIIFDASVAGESNRNRWNYDAGRKHVYDDATLAQHKDHVHFAVVA